MNENNTQTWIIFSILGKGTKGYDCLVIPGAKEGKTCNAFEATRLNAMRFCGNSAGLAVKKEATPAANSGTVCSKDVINSVHNNRT